MGNQIAANRDGAGRIKEFLPPYYSLPNWPKGLRIDKLHIRLGEGIAVAVMNGATLEPYIPLDQLARFLNEHVQGAVGLLTFNGGEGLEDMVPELLDEVTVPGRLHTDRILFIDFFHLPWAGIERIFDGWTLRAKLIIFHRLQLPSGVDANELFKLPTVRECPCLILNLSLPQLLGPPPLFDNTTLMKWLERSDDRVLVLSSDCLSSGPLSFLNALKKVLSPSGSSIHRSAIVEIILLQDFQQATQVHWYSLEIRCPSITGVTGGLGDVRDEELYKQLGEKMVIEVDANLEATERMGHPFEALQVMRVYWDDEVIDVRRR